VAVRFRGVRFEHLKHVGWQACSLAAVGRVTFVPVLEEAK